MGPDGRRAGSGTGRRPRGDAGRVEVDVAALRRRPGTRRELRRRIRLDEMVVTAARVAHDRVDVDLDIVSVPEGVVVEGIVALDWVGECRRCLGEVHGHAEITVREIFEVSPTEGETWPLDDERIDLAPVLHDLALGSLPLAPLCDEACAGPDPDRFPTRPGPGGDDPVGAAADPPVDPRWAALDQLVFDDPAGDGGSAGGATAAGAR